jgi:acetyl-CoA C-acetyltransferase
VINTLRKVAIVGVGHSRFGRRDDVILQELAFESVRDALRDASISQEDIDISVVGCVGTRMYEALPAVPINEYCGFIGKGPIRVEAACASGSAAIFTAYNAIASGMVDTAIAIGIEKMLEVDTATSTAVGGRGGSYLWEFHMFGTSFACYYAFYANSHMNRYGTTEEHLAMVAVKNHLYGSMNPYAHFRKKISVEDVLNSRPICRPLKLYDCCPISDGSASVILASEDKVKELGIEYPIWILGMGYSSDTSNMVRREDYIGLRASVWASRMAYKMAGIEPKDIEYAVVHDCFTIAEIMAYEDIGLCRKGHGGELIERGETYLEGRIPVNVDGGLKAKGHPLGATGCSMVHEVVKQLRDEAGERQVEFKRGISLVHNVGGTGHYCYVMILGR